MTTPLEQMRARLEAATEGPWHWEGDYPEGTCPHGTEWADHGPDLIAADGSAVTVAIGYDSSSLKIKDADADFIAHARTDMETLLRVAEAALARQDADWDNLSERTDALDDALAALTESIPE